MALPDPIDMDDPAHLPLIYANWRALNGGTSAAGDPMIQFVTAAAVQRVAPPLWKT